jgi:2-methylcitrate dehydratase PrpD
MFLGAAMTIGVLARVAEQDDEHVRGQGCLPVAMAAALLVVAALLFGLALIPNVR